MTTDGIERGYPRLRLAAALTLMVAAVLVSHSVSHAQTDHIARRIATADAFDAALSAVTAPLIALAAIEEVSAAWLAADGKAELRRLLPVIEAACARIRGGLTADAVSAEARAPGEPAARPARAPGGVRRHRPCGGRAVRSVGRGGRAAPRGGRVGHGT